MAITFSAGFAPEVFENTPVWDKVRKLASVGADDYTNTVSQEYGTHQVTLKGYKGFYTIPFGMSQLVGDIEIWECVCVRDTDYTTKGELSKRAFPKE